MVLGHEKMASNKAHVGETKRFILEILSIWLHRNLLEILSMLLYFLFDSYPLYLLRYNFAFYPKIMQETRTFSCYYYYFFGLDINIILKIIYNYLHKYKKRKKSQVNNKKKNWIMLPNCMTAILRQTHAI